MAPDIPNEEDEEEDKKKPGEKENQARSREETSRLSTSRLSVGDGDPVESDMETALSASSSEDESSSDENIQFSGAADDVKEVWVLGVTFCFALNFGWK